MAANLAKHSSGALTEEDYLNQIANPFSQASTVTLEPDEHLDFGKNSKGMEVNFDEKPKAPPVKYKMPDPKSKTSVNLSPAELSLIENMASVTNRPLAEVRTEFAKQKLNLLQGKAGHYQLYADKLASEGHR